MLLPLTSLKGKGGLLETKTNHPDQLTAKKSWDLSGRWDFWYVQAACWCRRLTAELSCAVRASDSHPLENCIVVFFFYYYLFFVFLAVHEKEEMIAFFKLYFICIWLRYFKAILTQNLCFQLNKITCRLWLILWSLGGSNSWITS